ncbi:MAG: histidine--tRNA ligase [Akkermansia sp.]
MPDARFQPLPGFRDFAPVECAVRNYLFDAWRRAAKRYGFAEWEAPTVESTELYLKKTGGELPTQLFRFQDQGERDITLRPELTASLGRIAAAYQREYAKPLKWFEIGSCFRYEKPQKGRLREFYQFNADILGEASAWADSELIALSIDCMLELGFKQGDFIVRVSDREAWIKFANLHRIAETDIPAFLAVIDKFERDRPEECQRKLDAFALSRAEIVDFIEHPPVGVSAGYDVLLEDLTARGLESYIKLDLSIVRGLAYYTGLVFEIFDTAKNLRAIAGGGRYDGLIAALSNKAVDLPATGFAMGDAVITHLINETPHAHQLMQETLATSGCDLYIIQGDASRRKETLALASNLRALKCKVDLPLAPAKMSAQFQKAEKIGARYALVVGQDYPMLELKTMSDRQTQTVSIDDLDSVILPLIQH